MLQNMYVRLIFKVIFKYVIFVIYKSYFYIIIAFFNITWAL